MLEAIRRAIELHIEKYLTAILYIIELNTAFISFFTDYDKDHGPLIREIWVTIFSNLNIVGLNLQDLSQSNYLNFSSILRFPFSRMEYTVVKELVIAQKKYENDEES